METNKINNKTINNINYYILNNEFIKQGIENSKIVNKQLELDIIKECFKEVNSPKIYTHCYDDKYYMILPDKEEYFMEKCENLARKHIKNSIKINNEYCCPNNTRLINFKDPNYTIFDTLHKFLLKDFKSQSDFIEDLRCTCSIIIDNNDVTHYFVYIGNGYTMKVDGTWFKYYDFTFPA